MLNCMREYGGIRHDWVILTSIIMRRNITVIDAQHLSKIIDGILVFAERGEGYTLKEICITYFGLILIA